MLTSSSGTRPGKEIGQFSLKATTHTASPGPGKSVILNVNLEGEQTGEVKNPEVAKGLDIGETDLELDVNALILDEVLDDRRGEHDLGAYDCIRNRHCGKQQGKTADQHREQAYWQG